jgi:hypothetical protein
MTSQQFLRALGITKRPAMEIGSDEYLSEVARAGIDPAHLSDSDPFGVKLNNALFANEVVARATLSKDFDRLRELVDDLERLGGMPRTPRRIAEIGGAAGVLSLYLAYRNPDATVTVYDHAERPLEIGRKWANDMGLSNLDFRCRSYEQLATAVDEHKNDLVFSYYGLSVDADAGPLQDPAFLSRDLCRVPIEPPLEITAAMTALSRLLTRDGIGVIRGAWREWGTVNLFEALRRVDLGVDWRSTFTRGTIRDNRYITTAGYVFVGHRVPCIARDSWEDARAFFAGGEMDTTEFAFSTGVAESFTALFESGEELLTAGASWETGGAERVRLLQSAGLLLLEHSSTMGLRRAKLLPLTRLTESLRLIDRLITEWLQQRGVTLHRCIANAKLGDLVEFPSLARRIA